MYGVVGVDVGFVGVVGVGVSFGYGLVVGVWVLVLYVSSEGGNSGNSD